jgi:hypothetical protein
MAVTVESFLVAFPEFAPLSEEPANEGLLEAALARAERRVGDHWREDLRDDIVELQLAHMLALSPAGRNARLSEPGKPTAYEMDLKCLRKGNAFGRYRSGV